MDSPLTRRDFARGAALIAAGLGSGLTAAAADPPAAGGAAAGTGLRIAVVGDSSCIPDVGHEAACLLVNGKVLVDTGWCAALKMRQFGFDPLAIEAIVLTHFHQDHYLGLPQLLFFLGLRRVGRPVTIAGPAEHLPQVLKAAHEFLQVGRFPELQVDCVARPLVAGDSFEVAGVRFDSTAANHTSGKKVPEAALVYKVTDTASGAWAVLSGDTSYHPPLADFARGTPLLVHDAAHTSAKDAADIARRAGAGRLVLIHHTQSRGARLLEEARAVFPRTELAREGETLTVPGGSR